MATKQKKGPTAAKMIPAAQRKKALNAVHAWKEFVYAMMEGMIDSATDLRAELSRPNSPLAGTIPMWALKEFISSAGESLCGLSNLNVVGELPIEIPDPLAGLYPARSDFGRRPR